MNKEKNIQIKFLIDSNINFDFRKILKINKVTIQFVMWKILRNFVFDNLNIIIKFKINWKFYLTLQNEGGIIWII